MAATITVDFWLTRCFGGRSMLTTLKPVIHRIYGTRHLDAFEAPGEPTAIRHLCEGGVRRLFGFLPDPLVSVHVRLTAERID